VAATQPNSISVAFEQFEASASVVYALDSSLCIVYCNAAWDRFAERNSGDSCRRERVLGTDVTTVIAGPLQSFYSGAFNRVLETHSAWEHDYECSSSESSRFFHMRVLPLANRHLLIENSILVERPHDANRLRMPPIETMYRDSNGDIAMCAHCRRTRRTSQTAPFWDWVPDFVDNLPPRTSSSLCENCRAYYFDGRT
jgi:hypothetical protein